MNETINLKMLDFSAVKMGEKFFLTKSEAEGDGLYYTKTPPVKSVSGIWSNAKGPVSLGFIKYDSRVWVRK